MNKILNELTDKFLEMVDNDRLQIMESNEVQDLYPKLIEIINYHNNLYYVEAQPVISDFQYDQLFSLIKEIEKKYPDILGEESPTQKINVQVQESFSQGEHKVPLLSLQNTYNSDEIKDWDDFVDRQLIKELDNGADVEIVEKERVVKTLLVEPKFDGSSVELIYKNNKYTQALTRGDGIIGEDITLNVQQIGSIPMNLNGANIKELRLRGEIVMPKSALNRLNEEKSQKGEQVFANTRNATAGSLRQLNSQITRKRGLICYVYEILDLQTINNDLKFDTDTKILEFLGKLGFLVPENIQLAENIDRVVGICKDEVFKDELENSNIEYDGLVVKVNELKYRDILGSTAHHPRWAMAYKYPAKQVVTKLNDVEFQVGRTGTLTPVAKLEPVKISGVTISNATLHNFDFIQEKDIRKGDYVWIQRSGEVIPYVIGPVLDKRDENVQEIAQPTKCPVCGSDVIRLPEEVAFYCSNINCPAVIKEKIKYFAAKDSMDIEGLGDKIVDMLVDTGLISHFADLYKFNEQNKKFQLNSLPLMGDKRVEDLLKQIEKSKDIKLSRLINALGIRFVGKKNAKILEKSLYDRLITENKSVNEFDYNTLIIYLTDEGFLMEVYGIGEKSVESLKQYLTQEVNVKIIKELADSGMKFNNFDSAESKDIEVETGLNGLRFSVSGKFSISRPKIVKIFEDFGAEWDEKPLQETDILLVSDGAGSKVAIAEKYGIRIINGEKELFSEFSFLKEKFKEFAEKEQKNNNNVQQLGLFG